MDLAAPTLLPRTHVEFTLPVGYVDAAGVLHRDGVMRVATALDEVQPQQDARVQANQAYLSILLLGRVVIRLGSLSPVPTSVVEGLYSADFAYLQDLYMRLNDAPDLLAETRCPECGTEFAVDVAGV